MTPAFGFSVGDFISAIDLVRKVSKALKKGGGASNEYQHVIIELKGLETVLQHLAALEPTEDNIHHVNAICGMALACQLPLHDFLVKLQKYESTLSPFADQSSFRGARHKTKWVVVISEEVSKLRNLVAAKVMSINLLLATHASQTLSRMEARGAREHTTLMTEILQQREDTINISKELRNLETEELKAHETVEKKLDQIANTATSVQRSIQNTQSIGQQLLAFLGSFPSEIREALRKITQTDLNIYNLLLQVHRDIANRPTTLLPSNIRFEDALGRPRELPYEYFRHWEPFEGFLRAEFKNVPGESKVSEGQYHIFDVKRQGVLLHKETWSQSVFPGAELSMSMIVSLIRMQAGRCPRKNCTGNVRESVSGSSHCIECKLELSTPPSPITPILDRSTLPEDGDDVQKRQLQEDTEMFGYRPEPWDPDEVKETMRSNVPGTTHERTSGNFSTNEDLRRKKPHYHDITVIDWNSGETPIDAWLNQSAGPVHSASTPPDSFSAIGKQAAREREEDELTFFRKVHIANAVEPKRFESELEAENCLLELDVSVYYRNVLDQFPLVPIYLARRLAEANVYHSTQLKFQREHSSKYEEDQPGSHSVSIPKHKPQADAVSSDYFSDMPGKMRQEDIKRDAKPDFDSGSLEFLVGSSNLLNEAGIGTDSFWRGGSPHRRSASASSSYSSMNDSLRGDQPIVDFSEQNLAVHIPPHGHEASVPDDLVPGLPPPPVELGATKSFKCDICGKEIHITRRREWQVHVYADLRPYICTSPVCNSPNKAHKSLQALVHHMRLHSDHLIAKKSCFCKTPVVNGVDFHDPMCCSKANLYRSAEVFKSFKCLFCGKIFIQQGIEYFTHLGRHMEQVTFAILTKPYTDWEFYTDISSSRSSSNIENDPISESNGLSSLEFQQEAVQQFQSCGSSFAGDIDLCVHLQADCRAKPYACAICEAKSQTRQRHDRHVRGYEEDFSAQRLFACFLCNVKFTRRADLARHIDLCRWRRPDQRRDPMPSGSVY